jgi:CHAD domain-containing protein
MAKAWKIPYLNPDRELLITLKKILNTRFREMVSYETGAIEGSDIEELHSMRVASRRVQAVMKVFRNVFPVKRFKYQYEKIRGIKNYLGVVRHYDVFIDELIQFRNGLQLKEQNAINLLISRQKNLREQSRKEMIKFLNTINKEKYKQDFINFLSVVHLVKNTKIDRTKSFKDNIKSVLPIIYDKFTSYSEDVIKHPAFKDILHRMRIAGKPLRYIMEIGVLFFSPDFKNCYQELKEEIERLGIIHDCDVIIPELKAHLSEIRYFNTTISDKRDQLQTKGLREMIKQYSNRRSLQYEKFCNNVKKWKNDDFRSKMVNSMEEKNNINTNPYVIYNISKENTGVNC